MYIQLDTLGWYLLYIYNYQKDTDSYHCLVVNEYINKKKISQDSV